MTISPTGLFSLPDDILLTVRDCISVNSSDIDPTAGLVSHFAFSGASRRLRALYVFPDFDQEQRFWKDVCACAGYGRPMRRDFQPSCQPSMTKRARTPDDAGAVLTWKHLAQCIVAHQSVCEIRSCRDAGRWFAAQPATARQLTFHPLYYYLHFSPTPAHSPTAASAPDAAGLALSPHLILQTHLPPYPDCALSHYAPLSAHACAASAFACSPPVRRISFVRGPGAQEDDDVVGSVFNPDGCTLLDVNRLLLDILPRTLDEMRTAAAHYRSLAEAWRAAAPRAAGMTLAEMLSAPEHCGFLGDHHYPYLELCDDPEAVKFTLEMRWDDEMVDASPRDRMGAWQGFMGIKVKP